MFFPLGANPTVCRSEHEPDGGTGQLVLGGFYPSLTGNGNCISPIQSETTFRSRKRANLPSSMDLGKSTPGFFLQRLGVRESTRCSSPVMPPILVNWQPYRFTKRASHRSRCHVARQFIVPFSQPSFPTLFENPRPRATRLRRSSNSPTNYRAAPAH
jgi:hypothetical protein